MLTVIRFIALSASVAGVHLFDGLGFGALAFGFLIGLLAVRFYWLLLPAAGLANLSHLIYAESTGSGKMEGALGVFPVELFVFVMFTGLGYAIGVWSRVVLAWRLERLKSLGAAEAGEPAEAREAVEEGNVQPVEAQAAPAERKAISEQSTQP
ncbi:hypothetical protein GJ654_12145 [Rhodoblastus acidophilus]|uniref:Uncharacterized protein n=1 Tax=Rhodoblastus acidophilus TaxID=1074 RepID=A0A6N8DMJ2_RHOAC|nr:hypothetical protein [Rhodoblastus acidophilus]MCW2275368.1 hypothetical protein [Rhodoblastus acidophilus]MTV31740.1 hypothetical protein [Rhodoblastus acidophilus]